MTQRCNQCVLSPSLTRSHRVSVNSRRLTLAFRLAVSERRRAEIAEKRARLAALKQAREEREAAARASASASLAASGLPTPVGATSRASSEAGRQARGSLGASTNSRNDEIENLLRDVGVGRERETVDAGSPGADNLRRSSGLGRSVGAGSSAGASAVAEDLTSSRASPTVELVASEPEWTAPSSEACVGLQIAFICRY